MILQVDVSLQCKFCVKKQIIVIENVSAIAERVFYAAIALQSEITPGISYSLIGYTAFTSIYNKGNKIMINFNDKNVA